MYRSMIGKLQYIVHSRPDIALAVGIVVRFSANPKENHLMVVKRITRYLKELMTLAYTTKIMKSLS